MNTSFDPRSANGETRGLRHPDHETAELCRFTSEDLEFKVSTIQGLGVFAKREIAEGTLILEYVGQKIDKRESLRRCEQSNHFIFELDDQCDLDGNVGWNPAKFINHSCSPNCEAEMIDGQIWIVAQRNILRGEELTFNYGYDLETYKDNPCQCGSPDCVGYMVAAEFFDVVRDQNNLTRLAVAGAFDGGSDKPERSIPA